MIRKLFSRTTPLCIMYDGRLVCYRYGRLFVIQDNIIQKTFSLFNCFKEKYLARCSFVCRSFRLGIRTVGFIDDSHIVISKGNQLYEVNINNGFISNGYYCGKGIRPLQFSNIKDIKGFDNGVYFGGYMHNPEKNPVNIFRRTGVDQWDIVYTFPQGTINHVHNIVADPYRQCLWIFTGDFDDAAAIWKVKDGFKIVERVAYGNQKWRACVAFAIPDGVLYATDSPFSKNFIYLFKTNCSVEIVDNLSGSCIYGCQWKDKYVFSTTVEPDGRDESLVKLMFSRKWGVGIEDEYVRMYVGDPAIGFNEIYKEEKDLLPFAFQFGVFKFPAGINNHNTLYFQPVATKKNDMNLMMYKY